MNDQANLPFSAASLAGERLERRPEARTFRIENLLPEVRAGRVRIPDFQRGLKWERADIMKLFDSIYRGFPVGTLLFWETHAPSQTVKFGSVEISAAERSDALMVVDGQQRLVSLVRVLLAGDAGSEHTLDFDLDDDRFVAPLSDKQRAHDSARWLPLTEVLDSARLMQWALKHVPDQGDPVQGRRRDRAFQLGKTLREYEIPAYLVRTENESTLREIFERVNSTGKRMEASEVFDALHGGRTGSKPASIRDIAEDLRALGLGLVEEKILYSLLRVLLGEDISGRRQDGPPRLSPDRASEAFQHTLAAASRAIQFVRHDAGIPHYELLPYKQPLVTLGKFFSLHPEPGSRTRELLVRWLWRGFLNGAHRGDTVSTRQELNRIDADSEEKSITRLLQRVAQFNPASPATDAPFNFRTAAGKLQALALLSLSPRDLADGKPFDPDRLFNDEPSLPYILPGHADGLLRSVANRLAHPPVTGGVRRRLLDTQDRDLLGSHGIDEFAHTALRANDALGFLEARRASLDKRFQAYFARHARWDEVDRPALASLFVADED